MRLFRSLLFWSLFALLVPQALWVRKTARRFPPATGKRSGHCGDGQPVRLLAIGDSIIDGVGAETLEQALVGQTVASLAKRLQARVVWQTLGKSGLNSCQVRQRLLPQADSASLDFIVVSVGVNDIIGLSSLKRWRQRVCNLLLDLRCHSPAARIALAGIPPLEMFPALPQPLRATLGMRGRDFHRALIEVAADFEGVEVVEAEFDDSLENFSADGFHPSPRGYAICAEAVVDSLLSRQR